ncbi:hypothetical protein OAL43_01135 [bacterium]|nr:hypothetical protein [bacterium]
MRLITVFVFLLATQLSWVHAEDPVFSGPQVGEELPSLPCQLLTGKMEGDTVDLVKSFEGAPSLILFVHELTRPGFALMRTVGNYASGRSISESTEVGDPAEKKSTGSDEQKMKVGVVFLTADLTKTVDWSRNVRRLFSDQVTYAVSPDGIEGPGAFGLNRHVTLTVLVANRGKVTHNVALIQPQLQADGLGILKAIVAATGGGEVPTVESLMGADPRMNRSAARGADTSSGQPSDRRNREEAMRRPDQAAKNQSGRPQTDVQLTALLRRMISKSANETQVLEMAAEIEAYVGKNNAARKDLTRIVNNIIDAGRLKNYGTPKAQSILSKWKESYRAEASKGPARVED